MSAPIIIAPGDKSRTHLVVPNAIVNVTLSDGSRITPAVVTRIEGDMLAVAGGQVVILDGERLAPRVTLIEVLEIPRPEWDHVGMFAVMDEQEHLWFRDPIWGKWHNREETEALESRDLEVALGPCQPYAVLVDEENGR